VAKRRSRRRSPVVNMVTYYRYKRIELRNWAYRDPTTNMSFFDMISPRIIRMTLDYEYSKSTTSRTKDEWRFMKLCALVHYIPSVSEIETYMHELTAMRP
jgi:hypothetical protein